MTSRARYAIFLCQYQCLLHWSDLDLFDASYRLRVVGPTSVSYSTFENSCGAIPDKITDAEVFTDGTIQGTFARAIKNEMLIIW